MALPVDLAYCYLIEPFGTTAGREFPHTGDDFARRKSGTKVLQERPVVMAAFDGEVIESAWHSNAGNRIIIRYTHGIYGVYGHLAELNVKPGADVRQGQRIGLLGGTGKTSGPHLHYAQYTNADRARSGIVHYWKNKGGLPLWPSVDAWAKASGLIRPDYKLGDKASNPVSSTIEEEDDMYTDQDRARDDKIYEWLQDVQPKVAAIYAIAKKLEVASAIHTWALTDEAAGLRRMTADVLNGLKEVPGATISEVTLADGEVERVADAIVNEQASRLSVAPE